MLFHTLKVGNKEYKLRLPSAESVEVEKKLGRSVLSIFGDGNLKDMPSLETLIIVLHGSLQKFEHGITLSETYDIYDAYVENDGSYAGMIKEMVEVLKVSGFFKGAPAGAKKKASQ